MSEVIYLQYNNEKLDKFTDGLFNDYGELFGRILKFLCEIIKFEQVFPLIKQVVMEIKRTGMEEPIKKNTGIR